VRFSLLATSLGNQLWRTVGFEVRKSQATSRQLVLSEKLRLLETNFRFGTVFVRPLCVYYVLGGFIKYGTTKLEQLGSGFEKIEF